MLQHVTRVFNLELVDLSTLDKVCIYLYTCVWFLSDRFVVFSLLSFFIVFVCLLFVSARGWGVAYQHPIKNLVIYMSCFFDVILILSVSFVVYLSKMSLVGHRFEAGLSVFRSMSTWSGDWPFRRGTLFSLGRLVFSFDMDLISVIFVVSSFVIINVCVFFYRNVRENILLTVGLLFLKSTSTLAFTSSNLFSFAVFMELSSILVCFMYVGGYQVGSTRASVYYFVYTAVSGLVLVVSVLYLSVNKYSTSFSFFGSDILLNSGAGPRLAVFLIVVSLLLKTPVGPFYHWLLTAHVEASTPISIVLAAILLKIPAVALVRVVAGGLFSSFVSGIVVLLCILTVVACSSQIWLDSDLKRIVALSSIVHMSGTVLVLFSTGGLLGSFTFATVLASLVSHTFLSSILFALAGALSDRYHTRDILHLSGSGRGLPRFSFMFFLACFFTGALPISFVFTAEAYTIFVLGTSHQLAVLVLLVVSYSVIFLRMLYVCCSVVFGTNGGGSGVDMTASESMLVFVFWVCLVATMFWDGGILLSASIAGRLLVRIKRRLSIKRHLVFGRYVMKRGKRHKFGNPFRVQKPDRDMNVGFETQQTRRRRRIRYYVNILRYRRGIGLLGRGPFDSSKIDFDYSIPFNKTANYMKGDSWERNGVFPGEVLARRDETLFNYWRLSRPHPHISYSYQLERESEQHLKSRIAELEAKRASLAAERLWKLNTALFSDDSK